MKENSKILNPDSIAITIPPTVKENLQLPDPALIQIYRDRQNRVIWMLGEVGDEVFDWVDFILDVNREDEANNIPIDQRKPIKCIISNRGGNSDAANTLVDIITLSKTPVWGIAIGICASAASMIFLACHKRFALPNVTFLFHQGSCNNLSGSYSELLAFMEDYQRDIEHLTEFYISHTTYPAEVIEQKLDLGDWYIRVPEALENGIIHEVVKDIGVLL